MTWTTRPDLSSQRSFPTTAPTPIVRMRVCVWTRLHSVAYQRERTPSPSVSAPHTTHCPLHWRAGTCTLHATPSRYVHACALTQQFGGQAQTLRPQLDPGAQIVCRGNEGELRIAQTWLLFADGDVRNLGVEATVRLVTLRQ